MFTSYLREKVLKHLVGIETFSTPSSMTLALGEGSNEVSGGGYARQTISFNSPVRGRHGGTSVRNSARIAFPSPTADWGIVSDFTIYDGAGQSANALVEGQLKQGVVVESGDDPFIVGLEQLSVVLGPYEWSQEMEEKILELVFAGGSYQPASIYFALLTKLPRFDDTGGTISEPNGGGYTRYSYGTGSGKWDVNSSVAATKENAHFASATEDWTEDIKAGAMLDAAQGGTLFGWGPNSIVFYLNEGQCVTFPAIGTWILMDV